MGLGWRVEWGFGLWFFHFLLYPTINSCNPFNYGLSIYGSFKTIQVKEKKKRQARADCVRPSRVPTSEVQMLNETSMFMCRHWKRKYNILQFLLFPLSSDWHLPKKNWLPFPNMHRNLAIFKFFFEYIAFVKL